jgi:uncharacterized protein (UPF0332 family)
VDGKCFLGTAQFLQNSGNDEAAYRSAVSRAYYACFLEARKAAFSNCSLNARTRAHIRNERKIGHTVLIHYFRNSSNRAVQSLGDDLASLIGSRQDADYNMIVTITADDAKNAIDDAKTFLTDLSAVPKAEIGQAMASYIFQTHRTP